MKVHRIITTIEVENDNSITSVELTNLYPTNTDIPPAITNITTNGSANNIEQVYYIISKRRSAISYKLKSIVRFINEVLDKYERDKITDDNTINEANDDLLL